ncbi:hypothetical protein [Tuwongella immobilis]|uniref:HEAT repeat domain-containing protein n=1 Tax=Tuwongella immobilis TaxID=692036 RepID=A0A6C2YUA2_9BACT|nr:hypothetical protein [Tuwongella immobilis]VIP04927.1 unnamed protein product [Tuwongella immobilis]VTS07213.1 unnamed protein product [Tuwongella immobilis]
MRRNLVLVGMTLLPGTIGCAQTWDDLTSRRFREAPFKTMFAPDDPITVLRNPTEYEADQRLRAIQKLKEPAVRGGSSEEQEEVMRYLAQAATQDSFALMRLSAIETLSRFEDPRVPGLLISAYHNAGPSPKGQAAEAGNIRMASLTAVSADGAIQTGPFPADVCATIRAKSLEALGDRQSPEGLSLLLEVAMQKHDPKPKNSDDASNNSAQLTSALRSAMEAENNELIAAQITKQPQLDIRLAAVRALSKYENQPQVVQTLTQLATQEKDVAMRDLASSGVKTLTGTELPQQPTETPGSAPNPGTAPAAVPAPNPAATASAPLEALPAQSPEIIPTGATKPGLFNRMGKVFGGGE